MSIKPKEYSTYESIRKQKGTILLMNNKSLYMFELDEISKQIAEEKSAKGGRLEVPLTRKEMEELQSYLSKQKVAYEKKHKIYLSEELNRKQNRQ